MGRGRAKAKQTKVARQLKYGGTHTDLGALQHELAGSDTNVRPTVAPPAPATVTKGDDTDGDYSAYYDDEDDDTSDD